MFVCSLHMTLCDAFFVCYPLAKHVTNSMCLIIHSVLVKFAVQWQLIIMHHSWLSVKLGNFKIHQQILHEEVEKIWEKYLRWNWIKKIKYYAILECGGWWWCTCQPNIDILITCEKSHYWIWMCQLFLLCRLGFLVVHYENVKPQTHAPARTCGATSKITFIKTS